LNHIAVFILRRSDFKFISRTSWCNASYSEGLRFEPADNTGNHIRLSVHLRNVKYSTFKRFLTQRKKKHSIYRNPPTYINSLGCFTCCQMVNASCNVVLDRSLFFAFRHSSPSSTEGTSKETVEEHLNLTSGSSQPVPGLNLPFIFTLHLLLLYQVKLLQGKFLHVYAMKGYNII
jgi:hypothetical protein